MMRKKWNFKKKVVVVAANTRWYGARPILEPIGSLPILASILDDEYEYDIIDCNGKNYSQEECAEHIKASNAEIVLITALLTDFHKHHAKVAELAKIALPGVPVVMGGVYPTLCHDRVMEDENVDFVMMGHAEERLCEFVGAILDGEDLSGIAGICYREDGEIIVNPVTSYISDVEHMTKPNYSKIDLKPYVEDGFVPYKVKRELPITTSYGCIHNCVFCAARVISGGRIAWREVEDVIDEMRYLKQTYQIDSICIMDDNIFADEQRAKHLFTRMVEEKFGFNIRLLNVAAWHITEELIDAFVKAGGYQLTIAVESGCDRVLHNIIRKPLKKEIVPRVVKICKDRGVYISANVVIGFPGETWDEIRETIKFGEEIDVDYLNIYIATMYPKTDLYDLAKKTGCIVEGFDFFSDDVSVGFADGWIATEEFTPEELELLRTFEWDRINFATEEKRKRFCEFRDISEKELFEYRRNARRSLGHAQGLRVRNV